MRCLITGVAGFIGGHLAETLLKEGWSVTGIDVFDDNYDVSIKVKTVALLRTCGDFNFIEGDIRDSAIVAEAFSPPPDILCHLAAKVGVRSSLEEAEDYAAVNFGATTRLLQAAQRAGVRRLVLASSSSVYGDSVNIPFKEEDPLGVPLSPYAASKTAMEVMASTFSKLYDQRIALLRFFTVYGPRQRPDLAIHKFAKAISDGQKIPVFGDGTSRRDYTHIQDIITGIRGAMAWSAQGGASCRTFNLASGRTVTLSEMIKTLERALGLKAIINTLPNQLGDMPDTWGDVSRARKELAYPDESLSFEAGIQNFVRWLRNSQ